MKFTHPTSLKEAVPLVAIFSFEKIARRHQRQLKNVPNLAFFPLCFHSSCAAAGFCKSKERNFICLKKANHKADVSIVWSCCTCGLQFFHKQQQEAS